MDLLGLAEKGKGQELETLWQATQKYCQTYIKDDQLLTQRIMEAILNHYLATLAEHFSTFELKQLEQWAKVNQKQVEECGVKVEKGLIHLKAEEKVTPCLQSKLKELVLVTNKMSQLE